MCPRARVRVVGVNLTRQGCCDLCKKTDGCDFAVYGNPSEEPPSACWLKSGQATANIPGYKFGATTCCPTGWVCPQGVPGGPHSTTGAPTSFNATVSVDLGGAASALPHTWKRIFGSGHAALGLRPDYQSQLKQARDELGLVGVRAHGTFDDDMGPVVTGHRAYNFTLLKQLWQSQVDLGLHPVVELSFMPSFLAGCSWSVAPGDCHADRGLPCKTNFGPKKCRAGMAYQGVSELPKDWDDWRHLVQAAVQMAVDTFGLAEVQLWRFEVWKCATFAGRCAQPHATHKQYTTYSKPLTSVAAAAFAPIAASYGGWLEICQGTNHRLAPDHHA